MEELLDVDIHQLKRKFNLSNKQEDFVRLLLKTHDYKLEESNLRDKVKSFIPSLIPNFQYHINALQAKDILIVYYDGNGRRIISMSPTLNSINKYNSTSVETETSSDGGIEMKKIQNQRKEKMSDEDIIEIGNRIINILKTAPNNSIDASRLTEIIMNEYDVSLTQFGKVLTSVQNNNNGEVVITRRFVGYADTRKSIIVAHFQNHAEPNVQKESLAAREANTNIKEEKQNDNRITNLRLGPEDMNTISDNLAKFSGRVDPVHWLDGLIQDIIVNIMDGKMINSGFTMEEDTWQKYNSLIGAYKAEGKDLDKELQEMIKERIEKEYVQKFIVTQMSDIIAKTTDAKLLDSIKTMLENRARVLDLNYDSLTPQNPSADMFA
jgi:hypothetical protein